MKTRSFFPMIVRCKLESIRVIRSAWVTARQNDEALRASKDTLAMIALLRLGQVS